MQILEEFQTPMGKTVSNPNGKIKTLIPHVKSLSFAVLNPSGNVHLVRNPLDFLLQITISFKSQRENPTHDFLKRDFS